MPTFFTGPGTEGSKPGEDLITFLDSRKPIATCTAATCDRCTAGPNLNCHFTPRDLIHFMLIASPSFLLGGAGICRVSGWWLVPWLLLIIGISLPADLLYITARFRFRVSGASFDLNPPPLVEAPERFYRSGVGTAGPPGTRIIAIDERSWLGCSLNYCEHHQS